jgi:hypothetical protein
MQKKLVSAAIGLIVTGVAFAAFDAAAASVRVQCEQRGITRSRVSVDGKDLAPLPGGQMYRAQVVSGGNVATSEGEPLVRGQVEFDFDSDPADIAAGATPIPSTFAMSGNVTGKILLPDGSTLISDTVACRVRSR